MLVTRADMVQIECVARGYLAGSGWKEYRQSGTVCGIRLPAGLKESDRLPEPIFTPSTKAQTGHDENISFEQMAAVTGQPLAAHLRDLTLDIYSRAAEYARPRGIILCRYQIRIRTGGRQADSRRRKSHARFVPLLAARQYQPGRAQNSYDKRYVRDYLSRFAEQQPPAPPLP
jgi:phosphoribosylaminoimidazole-succinocarboxamide synthase